MYFIKYLEATLHKHGGGGGGGGGSTQQKTKPSLTFEHLKKNSVYFRLFTNRILISRK